MSKNIYIVPRENPLILEIKIEPDTVINGLQAVTPASLSAIRSIINNTLLVRHYKKLIIDSAGIELGGSSLLAKMLMCYEKATSVKCDIYSFNVTPRIAMQHKMARLDELVPVFTAEETPKPEEYDKFFGFDYGDPNLLLEKDGIENLLSSTSALKVDKDTTTDELETEELDENIHQETEILESTDESSMENQQNDNDSESAQASSKDKEEADIDQSTPTYNYITMM